MGASLKPPTISGEAGAVVGFPFRGTWIRLGSWGLEVVSLCGLDATRRKYEVTHRCARLLLQFSPPCTTYNRWHTNTTNDMQSATGTTLFLTHYLNLFKRIHTNFSAAPGYLRGRKVVPAVNQLMIASDSACSRWNGGCIAYKAITS